MGACLFVGRFAKDFARRIGHPKARNRQGGVEQGKEGRMVGGRVMRRVG